MCVVAFRVCSMCALSFGGVGVFALFGVGSGAWVFVFLPPSFACAGLLCVAGVFVLGGVCCGVRGVAGGVARLTLRWV